MKFPDLPRSGFPIVQTVKDIINYLRSSRVISINGIKGTSTTNGTTFTIPVGEKNKLAKDSKPPFWIDIYESDSEWKAFMTTGEVVARDNRSGTAIVNFTPTSIPTKVSPLTITAATKIWCKVSDSAYGIATAAEIGSGTSWPSSLAPVLVGGDNSSGTAGYRYYKIAQFTEEGGQLVKEQLLTGHIDHFQPTLAENLTTSPSTDEGRVLKTWNATDGRWDFRYLKSETITPLADEIDARLGIEEVDDTVQMKAFQEGGLTDTVSFSDGCGGLIEIVFSNGHAKSWTYTPP